MCIQAQNFNFIYLVGSCASMLAEFSELDCFNINNLGNHTVVSTDG
jgi:hypothetical protein